MQAQPIRASGTSAIPTRDDPYEPPAHLATLRLDYRKILKKDPCAYCALRPSRSRRTIDHIEPRAHGGRDTVTNIVGCCNACNAEKSDRSLLIFLLYRVGVTS